ncbi:MAG: AAA family ATPase [Planctomycetes bacterium]|nr:AAA family ATPase [Planctomycetota bacterium]
MSESLDQVKAFGARFDALRSELGRVIVGQTGLVDLVLTGLFAGGHCLLEGLPGLGKTQLVKTLSDCLGLASSRVQFTPDLMPADVTGTNIIVEDEKGRRTLQFRRGPVFTNLLLADEINRATPKTQSALLEAMQEANVTVWGETHVIARPFLVLATQNPIEMEGTYPLPEAQLDRFLFKILVPRPSTADLVEIAHRTTRRETTQLINDTATAEILEWQGLVREVVCAPPVLGFAARLVAASHPDDEAAPPRVREFVRFGASPRAVQGLVLAAKVAALRDGRANVAFVDVKRVVAPVLRHRLVLGYQAMGEGVTADQLVADILAAVTEREESD